MIRGRCRSRGGIEFVQSLVSNSHDTINSTKTLPNFSKRDATPQCFQVKDMIMVFVTMIGLVVFGGLVAGRLGMNELDGANFVIIYMMQTVAIVVPLMLVMKDKNIGLRELGFKKIGLKKAVKMAVAAYFSYLIVMLTVTNIMWSLNMEIPGIGEQESYVGVIGDQKIIATVIVLIITFLAPIIEEVFFRGFVFQTLLAKCPRWVAFVVSATIFAAFHFEFQVFIPLFVLGLILNWIFFKSKSLYPGIAFHIINNVIALGLEYYIT